MFLAPEIFLGWAPEILDSIMKFGLVLTTVQNFASIGQRI